MAVTMTANTTNTKRPFISVNFIHTWPATIHGKRTNDAKAIRPTELRYSGTGNQTTALSYWPAFKQSEAVLTWKSCLTYSNAITSKECDGVLVYNSYFKILSCNSWYIESSQTRYNHYYITHMSAYIILGGPFHRYYIKAAARFSFSRNWFVLCMLLLPGGINFMIGQQIFGWACNKLDI